MMAQNPVTRNLAAVEASLNLWLRPKLFAEKWDNVGLLVGSGFHAKENKIIQGILLCNDMTPDVVQEAVDKKTNLIISYHPPIFAPLKAVAYGSWKEEIIAKCLARDISVYSPHTTLDSISGGITDRVVEALGMFGSPGKPNSSSVIARPEFDQIERGIQFASSEKVISNFYHSLPLECNPDIAVAFDVEEDLAKMRIYCTPKPDSEKLLLQIQAAAKDVPDLGKSEEALPAPFGAGRIVRFSQPVNLTDVLGAVKTHLHLDYVQLASAHKPFVSSVAICVGSGASLLKGVPADVYITGEMSHHDILDCTQSGVSVILCGHCNSERHFLPKLAAVVRMVTKIENVFVSKADRSPLTVV